MARPTPRSLAALTLLPPHSLRAAATAAGLSLGTGPRGVLRPPDFLGQVFRPGHLAGAPGQGKVYRVLQFPHIPRPGVAQHQVHGGGGKIQGSLAPVPGLLQEMGQQQGDISLPLP